MLRAQQGELSAPEERELGEPEAAREIAAHDQSGLRRGRDGQISPSSGTT